jgi:hypothetical protein
LRPLLRSLTLTLLVFFAFQAPALASEAGTHITSDENHNGEITVYSPLAYNGDLRTAMSRWNALPGPAPKFHFVRLRSDAELVVWKKRKNDCWNGMLFHPGPDEIWLAAGCSAWVKPALHELGHAIGAEHFPCTPYWQQRTVMVASPKGCSVKLAAPGASDRAYYSSPGW